MQYIAFAIWLADLKKFEVDRHVAKKALEWIIEAQRPTGQWPYMYPAQNKMEDETRLSLATAGLGSVYLYADLLGLKKRSKKLGSKTDPTLDLPPSVYEINDEVEAKEDSRKKAAAFFNRGALQSSISRGNQYVQRRFSMEQVRFKMYFMYAFERYASIREYLEGDVRGMTDWYDQGVENLLETQTTAGAFEGEESIAPAVTTAFGILFLTRSMQLSLGDRSEGTVLGVPVFKSGTILTESIDGRIQAGTVAKSVGDFLSLLDAGKSNELQDFLDRLDVFKLTGDGASRTQQLATMRRMVSHEIYNARHAVVKLLSQERSLDNVPALLFALTDPDMRIAKQAHLGMQFISRDSNSFELGASPSAYEFEQLQIKWTTWYLRLRPDAELLHEPE